MDGTLARASADSSIDRGIGRAIICKVRLVLAFMQDGLGDALIRLRDDRPPAESAETTTDGWPWLRQLERGEKALLLFTLWHKAGAAR